MNLGEVGMGSFEVCKHAVQGNFGRVVGAAEMGEPEPAHAIGTPRANDGLGGLIVGEMAVGAEDALLELVGIGAT